MEWDGVCVNEAILFCSRPGGACPNPNHDCFTTGGPGCSVDWCCSWICEVDPFCCEVAWDSICVEEADVCSVKPPPSCWSGAEHEITPQCLFDGDDGFTDPNGGCDSIPASFDSIACGEVVCGLISTYIDGVTDSPSRDTDWYAFSLAAGAEVTWAVNAGVPTAIYLLSDGCPSEILATGSGLLPAVATACLEAGNYVAFVAPQEFSGVACDVGNNLYVATLSCVPRDLCPADIVPPLGNGTVDSDDLFGIIEAWGPCSCAADIVPCPTGNGVVDIDDLFEVINGWGVCE
jgi:hypothetical protein